MCLDIPAENPMKEGCSYQALLRHLNLNKSNELYTLSRPVRFHERPTLVRLKMVLYAILDVVSSTKLLFSFFHIFYIIIT